MQHVYSYILFLLTEATQVPSHFPLPRPMTTKRIISGCGKTPLLRHKKRLERRPSILAQRMAAVRRTQQSLSPEDRRPDRRRHRISIEGESVSESGRGGEAGEQGGGARLLSRGSFLAAEDTASAPSSPPREDSPLLGNTKPSRTAAVMGLENGEDFDEKKGVAVDWGDDFEGMKNIAARCSPLSDEKMSSFSDVSGRTLPGHVQ